MLSKLVTPWVLHTRNLPVQRWQCTTRWRAGGGAGRDGGPWDGVAENDLRVRSDMEDGEATAPGPAPQDGQGAVAAAVAWGANAGPGAAAGAVGQPAARRCAM